MEHGTKLVILTKFPRMEYVTVSEYTDYIDLK